MSGQPHDALYWRLGEHMAIRKGSWKLVKSGAGPLRDVDHTLPYDLSIAELYNLADDIAEQKNLAAAEPAKVKELTDAWQRWHQQLVKPLWSPRDRTPSAEIIE
jgi:arylsulfatase A-like enzyme